MPRPAPLDGITIVDVSRMLPGAVLARCLLDLGARLIKVEDPRGGDPMRSSPPIVDGLGAGFCLFFRGAESITLDLRTPDGVRDLGRLLGKADVFIESFRPGTLARWGVDLDEVERENPRLISCSLPGFGQNAPQAVGHDLNLVGLSGLLAHLPAGDPEDPGACIPRVQFSDVNTGLLACGSILAALLRRGIDGRGTRLSQPLLAAPLPLLAWAWADHQRGGGGMSETMLAGRIACYRNYQCGDGKWLSVGCLEPKFWIRLCELIDRQDLAPGGFDFSEEGQRVAAQVAATLATQPRAQWLERFEAASLPIAPINDLREALEDPRLAESELLEDLPLPDGSTIRVPGPAMPSIGSTPSSPAPALGADTERILEDLRD